MKRLLSLSLVLLIAWLLLSGHYDALLISLGVGSVALSVALARRMDVVDEEGHPVHLTFRAPIYWSYLAWEIIKANFDVARRILSRGPAIDPVVVKTHASQRSVVGRVTFANSITLTPGTIAINLEDDWIEVHALSREGARGLLQGDMDQRIVAMEGRP